MVSLSSMPSQRKACSRLSPHISGLGVSEAHTAGRSGLPKMAQRQSVVSCTQATPAGLPWGMPGIGLEMLGAMQQAAQASRQAWALPGLEAAPIAVMGMMRG